MSIEGRWIDCDIYLVGFYVKDRWGEERMINKTLIFDSMCFKQDCLESEIASYVIENFENVIKIAYVDIWQNDALRPKKK